MTLSGWALSGGSGLERLPPVKRSIWRWSKSICRSTHWRSSLFTHRLHLPPLCASTHTPTPTRTEWSLVSTVTVILVHELKLMFTSCSCTASTHNVYLWFTIEYNKNSWSGQHPYEWYCGPQTPNEDHQKQTPSSAWHSPHDNQWVSSWTPSFFYFIYWFKIVASIYFNITYLFVI